jgi:hypothetical protein
MSILYISGIIIWNPIFCLHQSFIIDGVMIWIVVYYKSSRFNIGRAHVPDGHSTTHRSGLKKLFKKLELSSYGMYRP